MNNGPPGNSKEGRQNIFFLLVWHRSYDIYVRLQRGLSGLNSGLNHINKAANTTNRKTDIKMQWSPIVVAVRILAFSTFVDYWLISVLQ